MHTLVATLPKSGTHLLNIILRHMGLARVMPDITQLKRALTENDQASRTLAAAQLGGVAAETRDTFLLDHVPYDKGLADQLIASGIKPVVLIRDPRDFVVSFAHHALKHPTESTKPLIEEASSVFHLQKLVCRPRRSPGGDRPSIFHTYLEMFDGWTRDPRVLTLRFEEIVGPRGGGSALDQLATGLRLAEFLGLELSATKVFEAMGRGFDPTIRLFRQGKLKAWQTELLPGVETFVWSDQEDLITRWGYGREGDLLVRPSSLVPNLMDAADMVFGATVLDRDKIQAELDAKILAEIKGAKKPRSSKIPVAAVANSGKS